MCYSAQIWARYQQYVRAYGADISIGEFVRLYWTRSEGAKVKIPKAMDAAFADPSTADERQIADLIASYDADQVVKLEQELFKQRKRLADAERSLQKKTTKAALESKRIATDKVAWIQGKLSDIRRTDLIGEDSRIFPGWYAPVMVMENGRRVIKPMRYQCRPAGAPPNYDVKFPGTYNARRDNLEGQFWKSLFGYSHALIVANAFYENVALHAMQHRDLAPSEKEQNVVLEFRPRPQHDMLVACLWSHWKGRPDEPELLSFAAITDEPPPEVAEAGHDRCIVPIKPQHIDAWLNPDKGDLKTLYDILDDRDRPYYEHRLAA